MHERGFTPVEAHCPSPADLYSAAQRGGSCGPKPSQGPDALLQETLAFQSEPPAHPRQHHQPRLRVLGPEGKVRGTPQQIIEKYQMLARDAQLSNDRVAAEYFLQHAEHYTRMLAEATNEMAAEQEARQQQYQQSRPEQGGQNGGRQPDGRQDGNRRGSRAVPRAAARPAAGDRPEGHERRDRDNRGDRDTSDRGERQDRASDRGERRQDFNRDHREERDFGPKTSRLATDVIDLDAVDDTGLIDTRTRATRPDRTAGSPRGPGRKRAEGRPPASSSRPRESPSPTSRMASRRKRPLNRPQIGAERMKKASLPGRPFPFQSRGCQGVGRASGPPLACLHGQGRLG